MRRHFPYDGTMKSAFALFLASCFALSSAWARPWSEIETGTILRLKEDLPVIPGLMIPKDSQFAVNALDFFGPPYLAVFSLRLFPCSEEMAARKQDLVILEDKYGFEMSWNCRISMFLELRDFYRESYFETLE